MREFTAYERYLVAAPPRSAAKHLFDCLANGAPAAHELIDRYRLRTKGKSVTQVCIETVMALRSEFTGIQQAGVPQELSERLLDYLTERGLQGDQDAQKLNIELMQALGMMKEKP